MIVIYPHECWPHFRLWCRAVVITDVEHGYGVDVLAIALPWLWWRRDWQICKYRWMRPILTIRQDQPLRIFWRNVALFWRKENERY